MKSITTVLLDVPAGDVPRSLRFDGEAAILADDLLARGAKPLADHAGARAASGSAAVYVGEKNGGVVRWAN